MTYSGSNGNWNINRYTRFAFKYLFDVLKKIIENAGFTDRQVFPTSIGYKSWETDEVISSELYKNLAMALG